MFGLIEGILSFAFGMVEMVLGLVFGAVELVFGLLGGIFSLVISLGGILLAVALFKLISSRRKHKKQHEHPYSAPQEHPYADPQEQPSPARPVEQAAPEDEFDSFYDQFRTQA